jgi:anaerobic magnesium-protoporphyrin IX monomethyl ester cyclase
VAGCGDRDRSVCWTRWTRARRSRKSATPRATLKGAGIRACWFLQLGYLGEEWADLLLTRDLIREERPDEIGVSVSYPLPGTPFYEAVREQLGAKRNWQDTGDLAMLFQGTYTAAFYRMLRNLLHAEVDARAGGDDGRDFDAAWADLARRESDCRTAVLVE